MSGSGVGVGYMNVHHQRIVARAKVEGDARPHFITWCGRCGRHYVASDTDVISQRCPYHDHGTPALSADSPGVEWLSN